jgi:uncharacterized membrane protein YjjB (DUF3815 family)
MIEILAGLIPLLPAFGAFTIPIIYLASRRRLVVMGYGALISLISLVISISLVVDVYNRDTPVVFKLVDGLHQ